MSAAETVQRSLLPAQKSAGFKMYVWAELGERREGQAKNVVEDVCSSSHAREKKPLKFSHFY